MPLGQKFEFGRGTIDRDPDKVHNAVSVLVHDTRIYDIRLKAKFTKTRSVEIKVNFGEEIKKHFSAPWNCGQKLSCQSVVFSVTVFPSGGPYPPLRGSYRITPVIDITIYAPNTGDIQNVKGLLKVGWQAWRKNSTPL